MAVDLPTQSDLEKTNIHITTDSNTLYLVSLVIGADRHVISC
jgi:hypothetical protein